MDVNKQSKVSLREITAETVNTILKLDVNEDQKKYVARNSRSIAQAYFNKNAWFRAIYADDTPVGFIMFEINEEKAEYFLWRFMIDQRYQKFGYGKKALQHGVEYIKTFANADYLISSYVPGEHSAGGFYRKFGFEETGEVHETENVIRLKLR